MRRFLVVALVITLVVFMLGSLAGNALLYNYYLRQQRHLEARSNYATDLEKELDGARVQLREAEDQVATAEGQHRQFQATLTAQQSAIATLQAQIPTPDLRPTPTPSTEPTISLLAPAEGQKYEEGEEVQVRWSAHNQDRVERVTLRVDSALVATYQVTGGGAPSVEGTLLWTAKGAGAHLLAVQATSPAGVDSRPASVTVEVVAASDSGLDPANMAIMETIEQIVIELRGLEPLRPVTRTLFTPDELVAFVLRELDEDYPLEEARRDAIELAAFDLVPAGIDLQALMVALYGEQIAGFYDTMSQSLTVISADDEMGPLDKSTYAHEFTHALQDQHYDLEALDSADLSDDAAMAVAALIEGDATLLMQQYMLEYLSTDELFQLYEESLTFETTVLDSAPAFIQAQFAFPYEAGFEFVQAIYERGGYGAIDDAFRRPPQSTEQILHLDKYLADEAPQVVSLPPLTDTLGSGWEWVDENVMGELALRLYLAEQVSSRQAAAAAAGWGGDRYAVYHEADTGGIVMVMWLVWDAISEAAEFMDVYQAYGQARFGAPPQQEGTAVCWQGEEALCAFHVGVETLVIRGLILDQIDSVKGLFPDF